MAQAARKAKPAGAPRKLRVVQTRQPTTFAEPDEVQEFADDLPDKFLHCREMSHNWRPWDVGRHRDGGFERTLRCVRCRTRKIQHLDANGMLAGATKMVYPNGYLHEGLGRISGEGRGLLRLASIRRLDADLVGE